MPYKLTDDEARLYRAVTDYVREEFNRAEALQNDKRAGTVGFALTVLQRRLASSPEAIYQSLTRRRNRLESRLREVKLMQRGAALPAVGTDIAIDEEDLEDLDDFPDDEAEATERAVLDQATAASTIAELQAEIESLKRLQAMAAEIRKTGQDTKWARTRQRACQCLHQGRTWFRTRRGACAVRQRQYTPSQGLT